MWPEEGVGVCGHCIRTQCMEDVLKAMVKLGRVREWLREGRVKGGK